ncbi:hypothetical protein VNO80_29011 [Phaseolus coccineus]|uniref:Uncharacterized protein n=1 Tax=Phaseolus coccineus TaxID=3886 RepID=A0AAN9LBE9_PHACN
MPSYIGCHMKCTSYIRSLVGTICFRTNFHLCLVTFSMIIRKSVITVKTKQRVLPIELTCYQSFNHWTKF